MSVDVNSSIHEEGYALGLDLGTNSLGWALIGLKNGDRASIIKTGVHIFPGGTMQEKGNEKPSAQGRREARLARRQLERRIRRRIKTANLLKRSGLLPSDHEGAASDDPYQLRAKALDDPLEPYQLGRALYHLAKRRGFKSGRKEVATEETDKDLGVVKTSIGELDEEVNAANKRTLGEYLATLNPHEDRIRNRYTSREMIAQEFEAIWDTQKKHHPGILTDEFHDKLYHSIFDQRPLKPQFGKVGFCPLETSERRAPRALWISHQVRLLQEVANLRVLAPSGQSRNLSDKEVDFIVEYGLKHDKIKFETIRKALVRKKYLAPDDVLNLEKGGREEIQGNAVEVGFRKLLPKLLEREPQKLRDEIWKDFLLLDEHAFDEKAKTEWGMAPEEIKCLAKIRAGSGYMQFSEKALWNLLPALEAGADMYTALENVYPGWKDTLALQDKLPALNEIEDRIIFNAVVKRALSETRKVVNSILSEYGKPKEIIVELARETRGSIADRQRKTAEIKQNEKERKKISDDLISKGIEPTNLSILKYRLWMELGGPSEAVCPYTGKTISFQNLFGENPSFDIEHILPYSRSGDDGFMNLTLCHSAENRANKGNKTPFEAYGHDEKRWREIMDRMTGIHKRLKGKPWGVFKKKRQNFALKEIPEEFKNRQLTDTSHAAREVCKYLLCLDIPVHTVKGNVTAKLRHLWGLNSLLSQQIEPEENGETNKSAKDRSDHRHHAIDAFVIACSTKKRIFHLSSRYSRSSEAKTKAEESPWLGARDDLKSSVENIFVSYRPNRKLSGKLNEETNYGKIESQEKERAVFVTRKPISALSKQELGEIVDLVVRETVKKAIESYNVEPSKLTPEQLAEIRMPSKNGNGPLIKTVRVYTSITEKNVVHVTNDNADRYIKTGGNHHLSIFENKNKKGGIKLVPYVTSRMECMNRFRKGETIVTRQHPDFPDAKLKMWLMIGDQLELQTDAGERIYVVQALSGPPNSHSMELVLRLGTCAYSDKRTPKPYRLRLSSLNPDVFKVRKVHVDHLGRVWPLNDHL